MRILHIAQAPGGVEKYIFTLLSNIDRERYDNVLLCSKQFVKEDFVPLTSAVEVLSMKRSIGPSDIKNIIAFRKVIKKYKPDIVYCHSSKAGAVGRIASWGLGVKTVHNAHGWAFNMKGSKIMHYLYICIEWFLGCFTDRIVCISNSELRDAQNHHIGNDRKLKLIYNGVDIEGINRAMAASTVTRASLGIPEDAYVIGMNGRLSEQKAPDVFVRMAARVKKQIPNAYFLFIGDGDDREKIEQQLAETGLQDCYHITGWLNNVAPYLPLLNVGVLLSRWEGFGLALCEYMVAGLPIVTTRVDAIPEVVNDGVNGILVDVDDDDAAAEAVIHIYSDKKLSDQLSANGRSIVHEKFNVLRTAEQTQLMFDELAKKQ